MIDYRKDAFVAIDADGRRFMGVEDNGVIYDRELHLLGQRKPVKGAKRK